MWVRHWLGIDNLSTDFNILFVTVCFPFARDYYVGMMIVGRHHDGAVFSVKKCDFMYERRRTFVRIICWLRLLVRALSVRP